MVAELADIVGRAMAMAAIGDSLEWQRGLRAFAPIEVEASNKVTGETRDELMRKNDPLILVATSSYMPCRMACRTIDDPKSEASRYISWLVDTEQEADEIYDAVVEVGFDAIKLWL